EKASASSGFLPGGPGALPIMNATSRRAPAREGRAPGPHPMRSIHALRPRRRLDLTFLESRCERRSRLFGSRRERRSGPFESRRERRSGLTLLELAMSIAVMVVGVSALASTVVTGSALNQVSHETEIARKAIATQIDAMRNTPFAQVFATYN